MRKRVIMGSNNIPGKEDAVAGDILCAKANGSKKIFKAEDYTDINGSGWTPIGVVVIPPSHDVYGTGEGAAVSLLYMSRTTPDTGGTNSAQMSWGIWSSSVDLGLTNYSGFNTYDNNTSSQQLSYYDYHACSIPSDIYSSSIRCVKDQIAYYNRSLVLDNNQRVGISPYITNTVRNDGVKNADYQSASLSTNNACSDIDGLYNTNIIISQANTQSDWKTAATITSDNDYSAACSCWRYHTIGTKQGDWYLPTIGELGYLYVRLRRLNTNIALAGGAKIPTSGGSLWSSTEVDQYDAFMLVVSDGRMFGTYKSHNYTVRAFTRF